MPTVYRDFDIDAFGYEESTGAERFLVRVESQAGEQSIGDAMPVTISADLRRSVRKLKNRRLSFGEMIGLGQQLADLLLPSGARRMLDLSRAMLGPMERLRIRLKLDSYALSDLPWEYLYLPAPDTRPEELGPEGFLVLDRRVSLVRYEMMGQPAVRLDPVGAGPLRMVALLANPRDADYPALNLGTERQNIEKAMSKVPGIAVEFFPEGRVIDLEDALTTDAHILHYAGHGDFMGEMGARFGTQEGRGALVLVGEDGGAQLFPVEKLALTLVGRSIRLAVFGACKTAQRDQYNAWTGVAPALTRAGIPAVVAMQYAIHDTSATTFSRRFYQALAAGETVDAAVTDGRQSIINHSDLDERDWGVPVLYLRTSGGVLFPRPEPEAKGRRAGQQGVSTGPPQEMKRTSAVDKRALRGVMLSAFDTAELEALCWDAQGLLQDEGIDLAVNLEIVGGGSKMAIVMNLIEYFDRRGHLEHLVQAVRNARPGMI
jgi:hypothetical protein